MKRLLFVLTFMSLTFPVIWGQTKIQKYAGTAMPYPNRTDSSITFRDGMTPFYINHLGRHPNFKKSPRQSGEGIGISPTREWTDLRRHGFTLYDTTFIQII